MECNQSPVGLDCIAIISCEMWSESISIKQCARFQDGFFFGSKGRFCLFVSESEVSRKKRSWVYCGIVEMSSQAGFDSVESSNDNSQIRSLDDAERVSGLLAVSDLDDEYRIFEFCVIHKVKMSFDQVVSTVARVRDQIGSSSLMLRLRQDQYTASVSFAEACLAKAAVQALQDIPCVWVECVYVECE